MALRRIVLCAILGVILGRAALGTDAMAVEEPSFKTVLHEGAFEVRDYPALVVAEVHVGGDQKQAVSRGFRQLAGYIFGGNRRRQSIAMTAPVAQTPANETLAMTAPVTQIESANQWVVRFTMPSAYSMETLPEPNDPGVHLRALPPTRFAVLRFSGLASKTDVAAKTVELEKLVATHHVRILGPPALAQYNPPWTLWFLRRNEMTIPVAP